MPKSCSTCGASNEAAMRFCCQCGARLPEVRPPTPAPVPQNGAGRQETPAVSSESSPVASGSVVSQSAPRPPERRPASVIVAMEQAHGRVPMTGAAPLGRLVSVKRDGSDGDVFVLDQAATDVGRDADVAFPDDLYLAGLHLRVERRAEGYLLWPMERRNGVYRRMSGTQPLGPTDRILMGRQVLQFEVPLDLELNVPPQVSHGVFLFGTPVRPPWGRLVQVTTTGVPRDVYHLQRDEILLGREGADITFPDDEFVSRRHVLLRRTTEGGQPRYWIEDLGSSNGTFLRLREPTALAAGDLLRLGDQLLRFELA